VTELSKEQEQLLVTLVEEWRALPANQRSKFLLPPHDGRGSSYLFMLPNPSGFRLTAYAGDVDTLIEEGLLRAEHGQHGLKSVDLTNHAFVVYREIKSREAGPTERRESYVTRYLDDFRAREVSGGAC
jgi:hypothetical protein